MALVSSAYGAEGKQKRSSETLACVAVACQLQLSNAVISKNNEQIQFK